MFVKLCVQRLNVQESFNNSRSNNEKTILGKPKPKDRQEIANNREIQRLINCLKYL